MATVYVGAFEERCPVCDRYFRRLKVGHAPNCPRKPHIEKCTACPGTNQDHTDWCPHGKALYYARRRIDRELRGHDVMQDNGVPPDQEGAA